MVKGSSTESWDDVDDEWITFWIPFRDKNSAVSFYDTFIFPRLDYFESWRNFETNKLKNKEYSKLVADAVKSVDEATPNNIDVPDRFGRTRVQSKAKKRNKRKNEGLESFSKRAAKKIPRNIVFSKSVRYQNIDR